MRIIGNAAGTVLLFLLSGVVSDAGLTKPAMIDAARVAGQRPQEWLLDGRDFANAYFSPLKEINESNASRLGFAWESRDFISRGGIHHGMESNPVFIDGVLYFSGPWGNAYAVNARSGKRLWSYDNHADGQYARKACCDVVNRGVAVWKGKVYVASLDGWLAAINAQTGHLVWRSDTIVDRHFNTTVDGAPHIAGDNILIGNAGADMGSRGYVSAYNSETGKLAWRFWAVPGDPRKGSDETPEVTFARQTWANNTRWDLGGGGNPWDSIVYDPQAGLAYLGIGNGGPLPRWLRSAGGGNNLFLSSIVAVDAKTGRMKWYYQETPGDSWDYTATAPIVLADLLWKGRLRRVLMQAPKNGIFYVLDRETGELLGATPYTTVNWTSGIDPGTGRPHLTAHADYSARPEIIWPGSAGGHGWQPMSYDPDTGLVYLPVYDAPTKYRITGAPQFLPGGFNNGVVGSYPPYVTRQDQRDLVGQPAPRMEGRLKAWNPRTGKALWVSPPLPFLVGGALSTAAGLVFEGTEDGNLSVYRAKDGKLLKRIPTGTAIMAAPMSYMLDSVQYVAVLAGAGGPQNTSWSSHNIASRYENFERLLVFKLDGGRVPLPPPIRPLTPEPIPRRIDTDAQTIAQGRSLFEQQCARCHQEGGGRGAYPDLWNMPKAIADGFDDIVYRGALRYFGMGDFSDSLSKSDVVAIKAFIVDDEIDRRLRRRRHAATRNQFH
ncbi:MAG TPA: PQQ-dependent dehydrogenase, methanol/ethanol family [Rhizomicrobium sp.]|jgi:quinohemoprotein ethanol dehydrogenase|nr:PQQ-dependent dehydrogenase, methanol/ethanol family [Rhizomicrobium sp.]